MSNKKMATTPSSSAESPAAFNKKVVVSLKKSVTPQQSQSKPTEEATNAPAFKTEQITTKQQTGPRYEMLEKWKRRKAGYIKQLEEIDSNPMKQEQAQKYWDALGGAELESILKNGSILLLDAIWLVGFYKNGTAMNPAILPRRQDLPSEAFLSIDQIIHATSKEDIHIIMLSYMWLHPDHPDPKGLTLQTVAKQCEDRFKWVDRAPPRWGIFWDYASMHQHQNPSKGLYRTAAEDLSFRNGLGSLPFLYSHPHTNCFRLNCLPRNYPGGYNLPGGANCAEYNDRGWPFVESSWMGIAKSYRKVENIAHDNRYFTLKSGWMSKRWERQAPLLPEKMAIELQNKSFTNAKDDRPKVSELYTQSFKQIFAKYTAFEFKEVNWGDEDLIQVAGIIQEGFMTRMESLDLSGFNHKFGVDSLQALSNALTGPNAPLHNLKSLKFWNTKIGNEGVKALAPLLVRVQEVNLGMCNIGEEGCRALAEADGSLTEEEEGGAKKWTVLNLSMNKQIGLEGGYRLLLPILKSNLGLLHINLTGTGFTNNHLETLIYAWLRSTKDNVLYLPLRSAVFGRIFDFVATNKLCEDVCQLVRACPNIELLTLGKLKNETEVPDFKDRVDGCAAGREHQFFLRLR